MGYEGTLGLNYTRCDAVIKKLNEALIYANQDLVYLKQAAGWAKGCRSEASNAIASSISYVNKSIEDIYSFKVKFERYVEKVKEFDATFSKQIDVIKNLKSIKTMDNTRETIVPGSTNSDISGDITKIFTDANMKATLVGLLANSGVQALIKSGCKDEKLLTKMINVFKDTFVFGKSTGIKGEAIAKALRKLETLNTSHGMCKLTGIRGLAAQLKILNQAQQFSKVAEVAGKVAIYTIPLAEVGTSKNLYTQADFDLIAQYDPDDLNSYAWWVGGAEFVDSLSFSFARCVLKTPVDVIGIPFGGENNVLVKAWDDTINETINIRYIGEGEIDAFNKIKKFIGL